MPAEGSLHSSDPSCLGCFSSMGRLSPGGGNSGLPGCPSQPSQDSLALLPSHPAVAAGSDFLPKQQKSSEGRGHQASALGFSRNSGISEPPAVSVLWPLGGCGVTDVTGCVGWGWGTWTSGVSLPTPSRGGRACSEGLPEPRAPPHPSTPRRARTRAPSPTRRKPSSAKNPHVLLYMANN